MLVALGRESETDPLGLGCKVKVEMLESRRRSGQAQHIEEFGVLVAQS